MEFHTKFSCTPRHLQVQRAQSRWPGVAYVVVNPDVLHFALYGVIIFTAFDTYEHYLNERPIFCSGQSCKEQNVLWLEITVNNRRNLSVKKFY